MIEKSKIFNSYLIRITKIRYTMIPNPTYGISERGLALMNAQTPVAIKWIVSAQLAFISLVLLIFKRRKYS